MLANANAYAQRAFGTNNEARKARIGALLGVLFGSGFAAFNLGSAEFHTLGMLELGSVALFALPALVLSGRPRQAHHANTLVVLCAVSYLGILLLFGGLKETGLYWIFLVPFACFILKGMKAGWWFSLGFLAATSLYMWQIEPRLAWAHQYSPEVRLQFCIAQFFYTLVAAAFNYLQTLNEHSLVIAKERAESAHRAKTRFLAAASHDIRQPAHALGMFVGRLLHLPHDSETSELVHGVDAATRSLQEMLDVFFDYSKLDTESVGLNIKPVSIAELFENLRLAFAAIAVARDLQLRVRDTDTWVLTDRVLLQRVLLNLVSNALNYTNCGGVLVVCRRVNQGRMARLEVWDTGIGIASEELDSVFEEFYQIDNPQRDRTKGLGLGLSMVKRSCELLGHPWRIRSRFGRGTVFTLDLPLTTRPQALASPMLDVRSQASARFSALRILVVEDDGLSNQALSGLLLSWGCQVSTYLDAQAVCASLQGQAQPDFIISDFRLPGNSNGIDVIATLRAHFGVHIPAVIVSGDMNLELKQAATAQGLVLLTKPLQPAKLRSMINRL